MSFKNGVIVKRQGLGAIEEVYKINPRVALMIYRKMNGNVIVYEAILDRRNRSIKRIDSYWLDVDPEYKKRARMKNKPHDRDEFGTLDKYAYGITIEDKTDPAGWVFSFDRFSCRKFCFSINPDSSVSCYSLQSDRDTMSKYLKVHHLYIENKRALGFLMPSVEYVKLVGYRNDIPSHDRVDEIISG